MDGKCDCRIVTTWQGDWTEFGNRPIHKIDHCDMHASAPDMAARIVELEEKLTLCHQRWAEQETRNNDLAEALRHEMMLRKGAEEEA